MEQKKEKDRLYLLILVPFLILCFWPFPSKWIGYSAALYIADAALIGCLLLIGIKEKHTISNTTTNKYLIIFLVLNIISTVIAIFKTNFGGIRQYTEIVRVVEWFIIYQYMYNNLKQMNSKRVENILYRVIFIIMIILSIISIIELFNLPLKDYILRNCYEMNKSGNIFQFFNRISGTFRNPNMYGVFLSIISIILAVSNMENKKKIPLIVLSLFFLYYTGSRTALVATVLVYIIAIILKTIVEKNKRILKQQCIVFGIMFCLIIGILIVNKDLLQSVRLNSFAKDLVTLNGRTDMWISLSSDIQNNWLWGNGIIKNTDLIFDNVFFQYMYYYGIAGVLLLCTFFIHNLVKTFQLYKKNKQDSTILFCIVIQLIIIISGITIQILDVLQLSFIYFLSIAYVDSRKEYIEELEVEKIKKEDISEEKEIK